MEDKNGINCSDSMNESGNQINSLALIYSGSNVK